MQIIRRSKTLALGITLMCAGWIAPARAATSAEVKIAIEKGLAYLHAAQTAGGYWNYGGYEQAATGAAVFAMLSQQGQWGVNASQYQTDADEGISYLLNLASTTTISTRNDGANICPGGSGSCLGVWWDAANNEDTYTTGLIAPALAFYAFDRANEIATTSGPLANKTWGEIAQGITNMFAASQSTSLNGNRRGGWRYYIPGNGDSDMSTTQWAIISLIYDQTLGATIPQIVKDDLSFWLAAVQDPATGVACYQPGVGPCDHSDTGGMLLGLNLVGQTSIDPAVQKAIAILNANWQAGASGTWYGNFGHPYAMWSVYKGLETTIGQNNNTFITNLLPGQCGGDIPSVACNWWHDYNQWIVSNQNSNGSWTGYGYWYDVLATSFYLSILPPGAKIPAPLDNFQCYSIKDSKGNLCTATAPTNVGGSCETEEDCGGMTDDTDFCVPKNFPHNLQVSVADQFATTQFDVKKPIVLCNPASLNQGIINDDNTHLEGYQINLTKGEARFAPQRNLTITNKFHPNGDLKVDVLRPQRLLVPTAKSLSNPVGQPGDNDVDHFTCYAVARSKKAPQFPKNLQAAVVDQFNQPKLYDVKRPTRLCTVANKNEEGVKHPDAHLMCYQVTLAKQQPKQSKHKQVVKIYVNNQVGPEQLDTLNKDDLCVPSTKTLPTP